MPEYKIGVNIAIQNLAATYAGLTLLTRHFKQTALAATATKESIAALNRSLMTVGAIGAGVGIGMAVGLGKAASKAGELQMAMQLVKIQTGATNEQMQGLYETIATVSHQTMFSMRQVADLAKAMGEVGGAIMKEPLMQALLPQYAAAAEVLFREKGISPVETVKTLIAFSHQLGVYDPTKLAPLTEAVTQLAFINPATMSQWARMGAYIEPAVGRVLGAALTPEGATGLVAFMATALQTTGGGGGAGGRGSLSGAALSEFFRRTIPGVFGSGLLTGHSALALRAMGFVDPRGISIVFDPKTHAYNIHRAMDLVGQFHDLAQTHQGQLIIAQRLTAAAQATGDIKGLTQLAPLIAAIRQGTVVPPGQLEAQILQYAFGTTGARAAGIIAAPQFRQQVTLNEEYIKKQQSIAQMQAKIQDTLLGRWAQFTTDLENMFVTFVYSSLPTWQTWIKNLDVIVNKVVQFETHNPALMRTLVTLTESVAGFLILGGTLSLLTGALGMAAGGFKAVITTMSSIAKGIQILSTLVVALGPTGWLVLGLTAAAGLAYLIYQRYQKNKPELERQKGIAGQFHLTRRPGDVLYTWDTGMGIFHGFVPGTTNLGKSLLPLEAPRPQSLTIAPGAIVVNAAPHQTTGELAKKIVEEIVHAMTLSSFGTTMAGGMNLSWALQHGE